MTPPPFQPTPLAVARARAILAGVIFERASRDDEAPLEELSQLVKTAGGEEIARVTQHMRRPDPGTFLGRGKVAEIAALAKAERADVVVFDHDLSPAQVRNLEKALSCGVIERSELILGIFARHARTKAAKFQVELARLRYMLPRLKRMWTHLERQAGGIGLRAGAGERQIETDRRKIRKRISDVEKEIRVIEAHRKRIVGARRGHFTVSLVGYTNAGKSTLMRALTGEDVKVEDALFATLDTKTKALTPDRAGGIAPPASVKMLVSDTVGFIRALPHGLVASFHATLEEARHASLLLHVVDVSHPRFEEQMRVVEKVLEEIDASDVPRVVVLNKIDRLDSRATLGHLAERFGGAVPMSAQTGEGLEALRERIVGLAAKSATHVRLRFRADATKLVQFLFNHAFNLERRYTEDGDVEATADLRPDDFARMLKHWPSVEVVEGASEEDGDG
jgi:GTP-binding protein HflX